ncbi:MAG: peptidyl-prolyl cis-trans isomerase [Lachnospiraceae bacterium]|nr:peptidyl-prolyl cis-trans isomerase [Lachnospiraceae bacterium]
MKKKSIGIIGICMVLAVVLTACGSGKEWVFSVNGEKLYDKEVTIFGLIYTKEYHIVDAERLPDYYDEEKGQTYAEFYKQGLKDEILSVVLLYTEAKKDGCKLTKEAKQEVRADAEALVESYGEEWLKKKDISVSDVERIYEMKYLGDAYVEGLSGDTEEQEETTEQQRYVKVYQVTFPTVLTDENGMVQSDSEGELRMRSEDECRQMEEQAATFAEQAQAGEDMETLLRDCDQTVTGMEKYLKYADLDADYQKEIDGLAIGGISNVIPSAYGYYVVKLLDKDAAEHAALLKKHETDSDTQQGRQELLEKLYATYVRPDQNYENEERWDTVRISSYIK